MERFGAFCLCVYVGAFVELQTERLMAASAGARLRIFCAGVWHNFALAIMAALTLTYLPGACVRMSYSHCFVLPFHTSFSDSLHHQIVPSSCLYVVLLSPWYVLNSGVAVISVAPWSSLYSSVNMGDVITSMSALVATVIVVANTHQCDPFPHTLTLASLRVIVHVFTSRLHLLTYVHVCRCQLLGQGCTGLGLMLARNSGLR